MARKNILAKLLRNKAGATAVEYGLIAALIVIAMIAALNGFATAVIDMWDDVSTTTSEAVSAS